MSNTTNINPPKPCGCPRTDCLKLFCVCFAANRHCTKACSCNECCNLLDHQDKILVARKEAQKRLSTKEGAAVRKKEKEQKVAKLTLKKRKRRKCRCSASNCRPGSCMCYRAKVGCESQCKCVGCENRYGKKEDKA